MTYELIFKVGKKRYFRVLIAELLVQALSISKTEAKRLLDQKAVKVWVSTD